MEKIDFLEKLKQLTANQDIIGVAREVNELNAHFQDYIMEKERLLQIAQMDAQENDVELPEDTELEQLKTEFQDLLTQFREKRKRIVDEKNAVEVANLVKKKQQIELLREIIQNEENINNAFKALNEIQATWKEIGDIPREHRDAIQSEYSRLIEDFFYNINIYKQLKEHDLKRNTQMKQEVVEKLQNLQNIRSIKEVEQQLKILQNNWEDIGPVDNNQWEIIKDEYWKAVHACYTRISTHYEEQRNVLNANLEHKKAIVKEITELINNIPEQTNSQFWSKTTDKIIAFQQQWKNIGFGPRKENEDVWQEFRTQCNRFFELKQNFFQKINLEQKQHIQEKQKIIEQAQQLQDSTDWKNVANQLIQLQKKWKTIGNTGQRHEAKLWKQFRSACDVFFDNRSKYLDNIDAEFENNLMKKKELIEQINAYQVSSNKQQAITELKEFTNSFNSLGKVPMKEKDSIYNSFKKAIDQKYAALKLEGTEKTKIAFQARIDTIAASPESSKLFAKEKNDIRRKIDHLQHEVLQLENNLGFFGHSQRAEHLKRDVEKKIERIKNEIIELRQKIKMIPT